MSNPDTKHIDQLVDDAERISVIGSPSSTSELSLDILGTAVTKKLVGELALFKFLQDASTHYALGQITEVELHNIWHEDPTMRSLIRQRGRIDAVSERQDTHRGKMTVSAVFSRTGNNYAPSILGTVPATGTPTHIVDDNILDTLLQAYKSQMFYLGHVYGSTPKLPLWFKHFGNGNNGAGEAYHLGVFGKTGSGKSVLAKMILMGYAQHRQMGLFVFDPQGEFSQGLRDPNKPKQMGKVFSPFLLNGLARRTIAYDIGKIQLDRWEIFTELLREFGFFFELGIKSSQYQDIAAERVTDFLKRSRHTLGKLNDDALRDTLTDLHTNIHRVYANAGGVERVQEFINEVVDSLTTESLNPHPVKERWDKAIRFFAKQKDSKTPDEIIGEALNPDRSKSRPIVVLNLLNKPADITDGSLCVSRIWLENGTFYQRKVVLESKEILGIH